MRRQELFRHSLQCHERCITQPDEDLYSHQDNTSIHHEYVRSKHLNEHFKKYQEFMKQGLKKIQQYRQALKDKLQTMIRQIDLFYKEADQKIKQYVQNFEDIFYKDQKDKFILSTLTDNNFESLTCFQMSKLIRLTDLKSLTSTEDKVKALNQQKIEQTQQQFEALIKNIVQHLKIEIVTATDKNLLNMIKLNESSIIKVANESVASEELGTFDQFFAPCRSSEQKAPSINMAKKQNKEVVFCSDLHEDKEDDYDIVEQEDDVSYYQEANMKLSESKIQQKQIKEQPKQPQKVEEKLQIKPEAKKEQIKEQTKPIKKKYKLSKESSSKEYDKTKLGTDLQSQSEEPKDDNQQEISKSISNFQSQINYNASNVLEELEEDTIFLTISDLDDMLKQVDHDEFKFNIRVKVLKVLYYCVIYQRILKVKFIAGDQTGISVFFTNYWSQIKTGCQLQLINCHLHIFKESTQVSNDKNFKRINEGKDIIQANVNGIRLSSFIQDDLYYNMYDKNCVMIRQVAQRLNKKSTFKITRMVVQVVFILNQWPNGVFCQVGDSSGLMLAYLKKQSMKTIEQGNVVKLMDAMGKRGEQPNKLMNQEIIYIDTFAATSKVVPFKHEFLEISDKIMTI